MQALLFFLLGSMVGGLVGVTMMCLLQINRLHDYDEMRKEDSNEENS